MYSPSYLEVLTSQAPTTKCIWRKSTKSNPFLHFYVISCLTASNLPYSILFGPKNSSPTHSDYQLLWPELLRDFVGSPGQSCFPNLALIESFLLEVFAFNGPGNTIVASIQWVECVFGGIMQKQLRKVCTPKRKHRERGTKTATMMLPSPPWFVSGTGLGFNELHKNRTQLPDNQLWVAEWLA